MTKTIREEVKTLMKKRGDDWRRNQMKDFDINDGYTDDILKLFEKVINEKLAKLETSYDQTQILLEFREELRK